MNIDQPLRRSCLCSFQNYQLHLKKKKETAQALKQKRLSEAARILSSKEANKLAQQARKIKRPAKSSSAQATTSSAKASTSSGQQALLEKRPPQPSSAPVFTSVQATTSSGQQALEKRRPPQPSSAPVSTSSAPTHFFPLFYQSKASSNKLKRKGSEDQKQCSTKKKK